MNLEGNLTMITDVDDRARQIAQQEIHLCFSSIVSTLASEYGALTQGSLNDLVEEAFELCTPVPDYEEAAIQNGWRKLKNGGWARGDDERTEMVNADSAEEACDLDNIDVSDYEREIYEHWVVSSWLANKLADYGEKVGHFDDFTVWSRTTTGQAIYCDWVIQRIATDLLRGN